MRQGNPTRDARIHYDPAPAIWETTDAISDDGFDRDFVLLTEEDALEIAQVASTMWGIA